MLCYYKISCYILFTLVIYVFILKISLNIVILYVLVYIIFITLKRAKYEEAKRTKLETLFKKYLKSEKMEIAIVVKFFLPSFLFMPAGL